VLGNGAGTHAVSHRLLTAEFQRGSCGFCSEQTGTGARFLRIIPSPPTSYHSSNVPSVSGTIGLREVRMASVSVSLYRGNSKDRTVEELNAYSALQHRPFVTVSYTSCPENLFRSKELLEAQPFLRGHSRNSEHYRVHKISPPAVCTASSYLTKKHVNIILPPTLCSSYWSLFFWLSHQYRICVPLPRYSSTYPANLILDSIILIIRGEEHKSRSSSLCSFLHPPVTSSLFGPNILLLF
jgi:hypothetical protein